MPAAAPKARHPPALLHAAVDSCSPCSVLLLLLLLLVLLLLLLLLCAPDQLKTAVHPLAHAQTNYCKLDHRPATTRPTPARFGPPIDSRVLQAQPAAAKRAPPYCRDSLRDPRRRCEKRTALRLLLDEPPVLPISQLSAPRPAPPSQLQLHLLADRRLRRRPTGPSTRITTSNPNQTTRRVNIQWLLPRPNP